MVSSCGVGRGHATLELNGRLVAEADNLWVTTGINRVAAWLENSSTSAAISHMAIGTGTTAPAAGDTSLGSQQHRKAIPAADLTVSGGVVTAVVTFAAGEGSGDISEVGIFDGSGGGANLFARTLFASATTKGNNDELRVTWTFTLSAS